MNEQSCFFGNLILLLFCRSRCRRRCSSSLIEEIKHHLFFLPKDREGHVTWLSPAVAVSPDYRLNGRMIFPEGTDILSGTY